MLKVHDLLFCGRDIACKHATTFAGAKLVDYSVRLHAHDLHFVAGIVGAAEPLAVACNR